MHKSAAKRSVAKLVPAKVGRKSSVGRKVALAQPAPKESRAACPTPVAAPPSVPPEVDVIRTRSGVDLTQKVRELLILAKEQGHLSYDDIDDALADSVVTPEDLDQVYSKLNNLEVQIVDQAEADRAKEPEVEEDKERLDILDDPVRMYLRQMGKVPLLTREQEVAICKRMETAELEQKRIIYSLGFAAKEHVALAEKLMSEPPKERFDRVIVESKVKNREEHLKVLRQLMKKVRALDQRVDEQYAAWQAAGSASPKLTLPAVAYGTVSPAESVAPGDYSVKMRTAFAASPREARMWSSLPT